MTERKNCYACIQGRKACHDHDPDYSVAAWEKRFGAEESLFLAQRVKRLYAKWKFILRYAGRVQFNVLVNESQNIVLGRKSKVGEHVRLYAASASGIRVGNYSAIGTGCTVYAFDDLTGSASEADSVVIGDYSLVGAHCVVMAGARVGNRCIIGAGSVLTKDTVVPDGEVWGGVPARRLMANVFCGDFFCGCGDLPVFREGNGNGMDYCCVCGKRKKG